MTRSTAIFFAGIGLLLLVMLALFPGAPLAIYIAAGALFLAGLLGVLFGRPAGRADRG